MSSPLKTNTETIQSLLNTINSLPNAGGGGSVETCTLEILANTPIADGTIYWTDGTSTMRQMNYSAMSVLMEGLTLECAKNSLVYAPNMLGNMAGASFAGCNRIDYNCLFISDNATFIIS